MSDASLEQASFENLIDFYREELRRVLDGTPASRLFTQNEREGLMHKGVLLPWRDELTAEALRALETPHP